MKKFTLIAMMFLFTLFTSVHASTLTEAQKQQAIQKMAKIAKFTPDEEIEHYKFLTSHTDAEVKTYLVKMIYDHEKQFDNPNSIDLMDIQLSLEKKSLTELIK